MKRYAIAVVPGDGIGREIIPEGLKVLNAVAAQEGFELSYTPFPWGATHYRETGVFMPDDGLAQLGTFDAIYFGAIGRPDVDDRLPALEYTFRVRKHFQQYVNYRPVRLIPGVPGPLRDKRPEDIDFVILRENTEGEFAQVGNFIRPEQPDGFALQTSVFTRKGIERFAHYAFQLARQRRRRVTNVTKSNTLIHSMVYWDDLFESVAATYPDVTYEKMYVDNAAASFVLRPERFDVVATTNMMGDILSDLGGALMGSLGLGPSGNLNPEKNCPSMFEPIHGSAPDIAGRGIANPIGAIWSAALMLDHLGETAAAHRIEAAIYTVLRQGLRTADLGGTARTRDAGDAIADTIARVHHVAEHTTD